MKKWRVGIVLGIISCLGISSMMYNKTFLGKNTHKKFILPNYKSGDAKLIDGCILTSKENMKFIDTNTQEIKDLGIQTNWLDVYEEEDKSVVVYANSNKITGVCILNSQGEILQQNNIFESDYLYIDPSILKIEDTYYITITEIQGNINNADINAPNGKYTVKLFTSQDLKEWKHISDIVSCENNIEDVELNYYDNQIYFTYEKEVIDKGMSSVCVKLSQDKGITWQEEIELLPATADQEPAAFIKEIDRYYLFYSSDRANLGKSYMGSKPYYMVFDNEFNIILEEVAIPIVNDKGILLYDVEKNDTMLNLLYVEDYLTDNTLIAEEIEINK